MPNDMDDIFKYLGDVYRYGPEENVKVELKDEDFVLTEFEKAEIDLALAHVKLQMVKEYKNKRIEKLVAAKKLEIAEQMRNAPKVNKKLEDFTEDDFFKIYKNGFVSPDAELTKEEEAEISKSADEQCAVSDEVFDAMRKLNQEHEKRNIKGFHEAWFGAQMDDAKNNLEKEAASENTVDDNKKHDHEKQSDFFFK